MRGPNSTAFDLSSAFRPDVAEYGAAVPPSFHNGTLCLLPMRGAFPVHASAMDYLAHCCEHPLCTCRVNVGDGVRT